jgi:hypothetical protein
MYSKNFLKKVTRGGVFGTIARPHNKKRKKGIWKKKRGRGHWNHSKTTY